MMAESLNVNTYNEVHCKCIIKNSVQWFASFSTLMPISSPIRIPSFLFSMLFFSYISPVLWTSIGRKQAAWPLSSPLWSHPEHFQMGAGASCFASRPSLHGNSAFKQEQTRLVFLNYLSYLFMAKHCPLCLALILTTFTGYLLFSQALYTQYLV